MKARSLALIMALVMMITLLPTAAIAEEINLSPDTSEEQSADAPAPEPEPAEENADAESGEIAVNSGTGESVTVGNFEVSVSVKDTKVEIGKIIYYTIKIENKGSKGVYNFLVRGNITKNQSYKYSKTVGKLYDDSGAMIKQNSLALNKNSSYPTYYWDLYDNMSLAPLKPGYCLEFTIAMEANSAGTASCSFAVSTVLGSGGPFTNVGSPEVSVVYPAPTAPTASDVKGCLEATPVKVETADTSETYKLEEGTYRIGKLTEENEEYFCSVEIDSNYYVSEFNYTTGKKCGPTNETKTVHLKFDTTTRKWTADSQTVVFTVSEVENPEDLFDAPPAYTVNLGADVIEGAQTDNVYFGTYQQTEIKLTDGQTQPEGVEGVDWLKANVFTEWAEDRTGKDIILHEDRFYQLEPVKWRALANRGGNALSNADTLFLLSDKLIDAFPYHLGKNDWWVGSDVRAWLNAANCKINLDATSIRDGSIIYSHSVNAGEDGFFQKAFSEGEQSAVATTTLRNYGFGPSSMHQSESSDYGKYTEDKVFLLAPADARNESYGFTEDADRIAEATDFTSAAGTTQWKNRAWADEEKYDQYWWLRSVYAASSSQLHGEPYYVEETGNINFGGGNQMPPTVRPAMNLDKTQIFLTSLAEGGKAGTLGTLSAVTAAAEGSNDWKLTLYNDDYDGLELDSTSLTGKQGKTVAIGFSGAKTGDNDYVSAILLNDGGDVLAYGRISQGEASGTANMTIPADLEAGRYTLMVFNEQYNGDYRTDYAGKAATTSLTVEEAVEDVYVFFQTVKSDGSPLSEEESGQALRDRLHFVYNQSGDEGWATLGILKSKAVTKINDRTATAAELDAVLQELRKNDPKKFTRFWGNKDLDWQVIDQMEGVDLKIGTGTSGSYEYLRDIWKMDLQLKCYHVTFDANAGSDPVTGGVPDGGYYIEGETISLPTLTRDGYVFNGWQVTDETADTVLGSVDGSAAADWTVGTADVKITAQWLPEPTPVIPGDTVNCIVEHYKAGTDGKYPDQPTETELLGGKIGATVTATPKNYPGYHLNAQASTMSGTLVKINAQADIVILKLYYDVNRHSSSGESYFFAIRKLDGEDSHAINGAAFALYQKDSKGNVTTRVTAKTVQQNGENGIALFKVPSKGTWYYTELSAPDGYILDSGEYEVTVKDTSSIQAIKNAVDVKNYRSATPDMLNGADHFAYVIGYEDGYIRPYGLISRAEATTIFFRLLKAEVRDSNLLTSNTYTDVADSYWANTAISTMTGLGIVQGCGAGTFDPNAPITRAQFAAICARFDSGKSDGTQSFSDIQGHWAQTYIERAAELGWIKGFEDGGFRPDTYITRAQAMTLINRVLNRTPEDKEDLLDSMNVWPDCNPDDWFYLAVQEATNSHDFKYQGGEVWTAMAEDPDWTRYEH